MRHHTQPDVEHDHHPDGGDDSHADRGGDVHGGGEVDPQHQHSERHQADPQEDVEELEDDEGQNNLGFVWDGMKMTEVLITSNVFCSP